MLNSEFADTLVSLRPLQPTLSQMKSPLEDWLKSDLLVIEVLVLELCKESVHHALQRLVIRARSQGLRILLFVTPRSPTGSERRTRGEHSMERPIRRWNDWMSCAFELKGFCSCRFADKDEGVHTLYYVGTSFPAPWDEPGWIEGSCARPAVRSSVAHTPLGVNQGLCGIIRYASRALKERFGSHIPRLESSEDGYVEQLPRHGAAPLGHGGLNPIVGGASADTRLADNAAFTPETSAEIPNDPQVRAKVEDSTAYPTDSKEKENERRRRLKEQGIEIERKKKNIPVEDLSLIHI